MSCPFSVNQMALKSDVRAALINKKANACPMAVRLAWHSAGTFSKEDGSGGTNGGRIRFDPERSDDANAGLLIISDMLLRVKKAHPDVSYADLYTLAGSQAVEFVGGPKVPHKFGRVDAADGATSPANGRLPDASQGAQHLRDVFYRMGFDDREIVVLSGAHTLGRCHLSRSGFDGPWTHNPLEFDNSYFKNLLELTWKPSDRAPGQLQYEDAESGQLMMLPTDIALKDDPKFRPHVERFAADNQAFCDEFAAAFAKLLENGMPAEPAEPAAAPNADNCEFREQAMHGSLAKVTALADKVDANEAEQSSGRTALHKAAFWGHVHLMPLLVEKCKINVNAKDFNGDTALHDAARFGHAGVAEYLKTHGADLSITNGDGQTAAAVAAEYGKDDVTAVLA